MLHIANGHATTSLIEKAGMAGDLLHWCDVLHEGPVPGNLSDRELRRVRARYLSDGEADFEHILADMERSVARIENRDPSEEAILWFEHDLFDQLNLIQLLDRFAECGAPSANVSLICIDRFPGHPRFKGLGELTARELATLIDQRQPVTAGMCDSATRAWSAFRADDPRAIERLFEDDLTPLPFLSAALRRHLEELPSTLNGLSRSEVQLLEIVESPVDTYTAFPRMHDGETAFYIGDLSFWKLVVELAALDPPLISVDGVAEIANGRLPHSVLAITEKGRRVLDGTIDRIAAYGIDRWLGGVHLAGDGPMWRWDSRSGRVVSTSACR